MSSDMWIPHRNRARGALLGLAIGDAVGATLEFTTRDSGEYLTDMIGGGPFNLVPGEWTDDTAMAIALAESLLAQGGFNEADLMTRFCDWMERGTYSCQGRCFDIGMTVRESLDRFRLTGDPVAGSTDPFSAGNGSLMRLAPVPVLYWNQGDLCATTARGQSRTTHGAIEAVEACAAYSTLVADAISGQTREQIFMPRHGEWPKTIAEIMRMVALSRERNAIQSDGYVIHSFEAALWSVRGATDFRDAILRAANLGGDADTTAAIAGQLAGAIYGESGIPPDWLKKLAWRDRITKLADDLFSQSVAQVPPQGTRQGTP